ncbi:MAG: hypothetical protein ACRDG3_14045, partial [Tepidiformaceae bacterium]
VSRRADGIPVRAGQSAAFVEGKLIGAAASHREALVLALTAIGPPAGALVTMYRGAETIAAEAAALRESLAAQFEGVEFELIDGGQDIHAYIASVEA